jgi:hypothetical protein
MSHCLINYELRYEDIWWNGGIAPQFLILIVDGAEWSASRPCINPEKRGPVTFCIRGWVGPRAGLDAVKRKNIAFLAESNPQFPDRPAHIRENTPTELLHK